jgi:hypothetical protein
MAKKNRARTDGIIDCACVIHGTGYEWEYVEKLYNMLTRMIPAGIRFHVYTEHDRSVPPHMIKHVLDDWGVSGPKKSWWYKMQLFNPEHFSGNMLYLDLDVVIIRELTWMTMLSTDYFWTIKDFRYLQTTRSSTINSSAMWFNVEKFSWVWNEFQKSNILENIKRFPGDQDFLNHVLDVNQRRFFEDRYFESYRWQCQDGGYDFQRRVHRRPGIGIRVGADTSVIVFHGKPKPHQVSDVVINDYWK